MSITTIEMGYSEWQARFKPRVINEGGENPLMVEDEFQAEELMMEAGENRVWTLKYADEGEGEVLVNGLWSVGCIGFFITDVEFKDDEDYVVSV
ncbi:hypothetical protein [Marinobacterium arenosum]|uniref:hypothetical protein n=1 Tax=Marinobacterium arenosum TaxID=2862496 RepID=UPI001C964E2A|nr:hypothetical protein [Marinobacterium arenosum]MBY4677160.1 hypothetical protein [Marinobacterium arenosum]